MHQNVDRNGLFSTFLDEIIDYLIDSTAVLIDRKCANTKKSTRKFMKKNSGLGTTCSI